jgi:hypothetical protein
MTETTEQKLERLQGEVVATQAQLDREKMSRGGKGGDNPFAGDEPITPAQLAAILREHGSKKAQALAAEAGRRIDGAPIGSPFRGRDYTRGPESTA